MKTNFEIDRISMFKNDIHNSKIISYKPNNLATMEIFNNNINILIRREENHLILHESHLEIVFMVSHHADALFSDGANR